VSAFGDQFGLFCDTLTNDTVPTGLSLQEPYQGLTEPLVTTGSAKVVPPPPTPPGAPGEYELYCPGTPVGNIALNDVNTTGTITPADPSPGEQFNVTGYQSTINLPASIAAAAAALGNTDIGGTATATLDASGATPAQISTGTMNFDTPLPPIVPSSGVTLTVPSSAATIGPFTASGGVISIAEDASVQLDLIVSGSDLTLRCSAYADDSEPSGIVESSPPGSPMSPVIATTGGGSPGAPSSPTLSVGPSTQVTNGESVSLTGTGFQDGSPGNVLECNNSPGQPTVNLGAPVSNAVAVGCTAPTFNLVTTSSSGTLSTSYVVTQGTVGPPCGASTDIITTCPETDSAGQDPATDAALYPCPPTPAQSAAGATCTLTFGDAAGDSATAPILFPNEGVTPEPVTAVPTTTAPDPATQSTTTQPVAPVTASTDPSGDAGSTTTPSSNSTGASDPASSTPTTHAAATKAASSNNDPAPSAAASPVRASSSALAFTGPGAATGWVVVAGSALIVLGLAMLLLVDAPRRLRWALVGRRGRFDRKSAELRPSASSAPDAQQRDMLWLDDTW
jgi:hypothetical protein